MRYAQVCAVAIVVVMSATTWTASGSDEITERAQMIDERAAADARAEARRARSLELTLNRGGSDSAPVLGLLLSIRSAQPIGAAL